MAVDYTCCECGRAITLITSDEPPEPPLCAACLMMPGWFRDPRIREILDPDHDGREAADNLGADR